MPETKISEWMDKYKEAKRKHQNVAMENTGNIIKDAKNQRELLNKIEISFISLQATIPFECDYARIQYWDILEKRIGEIGSQIEVLEEVLIE